MVQPYNGYCQKFFVARVMNVVWLFWDFFRLVNLDDSIRFEGILLSFFGTDTVDKHLVVLGEELLVLLQEYKGLNFRTSLIVLFPPSLGVLLCRIKREFLPMDTYSLVPKLGCVF